MKVLYLGGTGNISAACVQTSLEKGYDVAVFSRGQSEIKADPRCRQITGDRNDLATLHRVAREEHYDVVANFIAFTPEEVEKDVQAFRGQTGHYLFISTAAVYRKPAASYILTESSPVGNDHWEYARLKIACEQRLLGAYEQEQLPVTIVRPSYTFGPSWIPSGVGGHGYTTLHRIRHGLPIVSHGDGQALWVMTVASDFAAGFVGLFSAPPALGETVHITSDEALTWDAIYQTIAEEAGTELKLVHFPSELIASLYPPFAGSLLGDKSYSTVFDNSKIKALVPGFKARVSFREGIRQSIAWHDANSARQNVNQEMNSVLDQIVALHGEIANRAELKP
jgi:nucleoside-diphosphate-sugar epimerase